MPRAAKSSRALATRAPRAQRVHQPDGDTPRPRSPLRKVKDSQGRIDVLAARLLEHGVKQTANPLLAALYQEFAPDVETLIHRALGPRNRKLAQVGRLIRSGALNTMVKGAGL